MKILIINGSSRKGNTWRLTQEVRNYMQEHFSEVSFQELNLKDMDFPYCLGCSLCFRKGHTHCPHNKIIQSIMDKITESDGVIFSAATYNMQMPALTKNLIDHLCFILHRPRYFDKKALIISTTGGVGAKKATKYMADTLIGWGFNKCYQLPISAISWNDYKPTDKHIKKSHVIAEKFYNDLSRKKLHSPSFAALIPYNLFRGMSYDYRKGKQYEAYDGDFWEETGLINTVYSPQVPLPVHKKIFGSLLYGLARKLSKYAIVTYKK